MRHKIHDRFVVQTTLAFFGPQTRLEAPVRLSGIGRRRRRLEAVAKKA